MNNAKRDANLSPQKIKMIGMVCLLVGLCLLGGALKLFLDTRAFLSSAKETTGVVVDLERKRDEDSTTYAPVFRFKDATGVEYTVTSSVSSKPAAHNVGASVPVLFDPQSPRNAKINSFRDLWFGATICATLGLVFSMIGLFRVLSRPDRATAEQNISSGTISDVHR